LTNERRRPSDIFSGDTKSLGCVRLLKEVLDRRGVISKRRTSKTGTESGGHSFSRGALYALLSNPIYVGEIRHKNLRHPGQHQAIVDRALWERTQQQLQEHRVRAESYYVSRNFPAQGLAPSRIGWLLPARELEDRVAAAVVEMLCDESAALEAGQKTDIESSQVDRVLHAARTWRRRLQSEAEQTSAIAALVDRVELKPDGVTVSIKLPIAGAKEARAQRPDQLAIAQSFPMQLKLAAIAAREGLSVRYVSRSIRLAFLAPDIVESIVEGRQPTTLTAEALTRRIELPLSWRSQRTALNV
jgi:site-specific DNA recombinase